MSKELEKEIEIIEDEKKASKKPAKKAPTKRKLVRLVGGSVSVYRTEAEMKAAGGEWEVVE